MSETNERIFWHEAFYEAVQLEFKDYKDILKFENEHQLSKEALKIDVLIIKKKKEAEITKNIGRIFKEYNICEFKSEKDSLSVYDYNKVNGYALLYSAFEQKGIDRITITFVVTRHPKELFSYLKNERMLEIIEKYKGVYYVIGDSMPVQILEAKKLSEYDNLFIKSSRSNLEVSDMISLLKAYLKQENYDKNNVYIDRIADANKEVFKEVSNMSIAEVKAIFKAAAIKEGWIYEAKKEGIEQGKELGIEQGKELGIQQGKNDTIIEFARLMLMEGEAIDKVIKWTKLPDTTIKELQEQIN